MTTKNFEQEDGDKNIPENEPLPPEVDPMVKYKLNRMSRREAPNASKLKYIQQYIQLGITPSGRKLDTYSSESGEECVYKRIDCRDELEFDLVLEIFNLKAKINPCLDFGAEGIWPNPYLFYWNLKKAERDEEVDVPYLQNRMDKEIDVRRRKIALELEQNVMRIPYYRIGLDDTDASDPENHKIFSHKNEHVGSGMGPNQTSEGDDVYFQRLRWEHYNNKIDNIRQEYWRGMHSLWMRILGTYSSGQCTKTKYPLWYTFWKKIFRHIVRRTPRWKKFLSSKQTETVFYGTMKSLYATQYIAEYDLLPNMDDPILMSQIALDKAMEIKEKFFKEFKDGVPYVDYLSLRKSKRYEKYLEIIGLLCRYQPVKMPPRARKVFFLNYFNVLSIQTQIWRIPEKDNMRYLWEMKNFWEKTKGLSGFVELSLEEIYHGILRCNRPHPLKQARVFEEPVTKGLPKEMCLTRLSLDYLDPRIHFALSVGCKSCPPIQVFSLYEQDCQLDEVAKTYVRTHVKIDEQLRTITLPILFLWYEKDFGNNQRVLIWYLKRFLLGKDVLKIRKLVTSQRLIIFKYERFNDELDPVVRRHPPSKCPDLVLHQKIIPVYWSSRI